MLFYGLILEGHLEHKVFIKEEIEKVRKAPIARTLMIFATDELNPNSFHKYIDDVPDIVLVIRTESGILLGAYS